MIFLARSPAGLGADCLRLVRLDVRSNALRALPPGLGRCASMAELYAGRNTLSGPGALPVELAAMVALRTAVRMVISRFTSTTTSPRDNY